MQPLDRFASTVTEPEDALRLDVAAACIAACAHPGLDIDATCARLDEFAAGCPAPTFDGLRAYCFETLGLAGNRDDYADPENSFIDSVLARRVGIPISLSVVMMELGRRIGVRVLGVGMPGHFLVRDGERPGVWCDPFHGGALCDIDDCRALFTRVHGPEARFSEAMVRAARPRAIVARMLANLEQGRLASDPMQLAWMCDLHLLLPDLPERERDRLLTVRRSVRARWN